MDEDVAAQERAMLAKFGSVRQVFAGGMTETFIHKFVDRFGNKGRLVT